MTDYDRVAKSFARSRKWLKWPEIDYFMEYIQKNNIAPKNVLDVGCGSGRLLQSLILSWVTSENYRWIDISKKLLEEAQKSYPEYDFLHLDMKGISLLEKNFDCVFCIASFHHLESQIQREQVLKQIFERLNEGGYVFLINWYLVGWANEEKYKSSMIADTQNEFGSRDFLIKLGKVERFYHGFTLDELDFLWNKSHFEVQENFIFSGERNIVTILRKTVL